MSLSKVLKSTKVKLSDNSPAILMAVAGIGFIATVVLACKATTKIEEILDDHAKSMDDINEEVKKIEEGDPEVKDDNYSLEDAKRDKLIFTMHAGIRILKLYAPTIAVGTVTIVSALSSYKILHARYVAASALAASLSEMLSKYRSRVRDAYGAEAEEKLYFGASPVIEHIDNGKGKVETKEYDMIDPNDIPIYAKFFDEANRQWSKDPTVNLSFLKGMELRANDLFKRDGYLLLNDVYRMLDIPLTEIGSEVGWFETHGDQFVDFGIFNGNSERKRAFVNGYEPSILLCFNCVPKRSGDLAHH